MLIKDFEEIVLVQMYRKKKNWKDLSEIIGKSSVYTKQVVQGVQNGKAAKAYRQQIAEALEIVFVEEESK